MTDMCPATKWILIVIAILAVFASADIMMYPGSKETAEIIESVRTTLAVLAARVLGLQYGRASR